MTRISFGRFAGVSALLAGAGGLAYALLFVYIVHGGAPRWIYELWFLLLMVGGLFTSFAFVGIFQLFRDRDPGFALCALVLGLGGALGGVLHGSYNLAANITPPAGGTPPGLEEVSKGFLRYGVAGLSLLAVAWLIARSDVLPKLLGVLATLGGALLVLIYLGRLYDFITPGDHLSLVPPFLFGLVVFPAWYVWLGWILWTRSGVAGRANGYVTATSQRKELGWPTSPRS